MTLFSSRLASQFVCFFLILACVLPSSSAHASLGGGEDGSGGFDSGIGEGPDGSTDGPSGPGGQGEGNSSGPGGGDTSGGGFGPGPGPSGPSGPGGQGEGNSSGPGGGGNEAGGFGPGDTSSNPGQADDNPGTMGGLGQSPGATGPSPAEAAAQGKAEATGLFSSMVDGLMGLGKTAAQAAFGVGKAVADAYADTMSALSKASTMALDAVFGPPSTPTDLGLATQSVNATPANNNAVKDDDLGVTDAQVAAQAQEALSKQKDDDMSPTAAQDAKNAAIADVASRLSVDPTDVATLGVISVALGKNTANQVVDAVIAHNEDLADVTQSIALGTPTPNCGGCQSLAQSLESLMGIPDATAASQAVNAAISTMSPTTAPSTQTATAPTAPAAPPSLANNFAAVAPTSVPTLSFTPDTTTPTDPNSQAVTDAINDAANGFASPTGVAATGISTQAPSFSPTTDTAQADPSGTGATNPSEIGGKGQNEGAPSFGTADVPGALSALGPHAVTISDEEGKVIGVDVVAVPGYAPDHAYEGPGFAQQSTNSSRSLGSYTSKGITKAQDITVMVNTLPWSLDKYVTVNPVTQATTYHQPYVNEPLSIAPTKADIDLAVQMAKAEAKSLGPLGMRAALDAMKSRANALGTTLTAVLTAPQQFEPYTNGSYKSQSVDADTKALAEAVMAGLTSPVAVDPLGNTQPDFGNTSTIGGRSNTESSQASKDAAAASAADPNSTGIVSVDNPNLSHTHANNWGWDTSNVMADPPSQLGTQAPSTAAPSAPAGPSTAAPSSPSTPTSPTDQGQQAPSAPSAPSSPAAPSAPTSPSDQGQQAPSAPSTPSSPSSPSAPSSPSTPTAPSAPSQNDNQGGFFWDLSNNIRNFFSRDTQVDTVSTANTVPQNTAPAPYVMVIVTIDDEANSVTLTRLSSAQVVEAETRIINNSFNSALMFDAYGTLLYSDGTYAQRTGTNDTTKFVYLLERVADGEVVPYEINENEKVSKNFFVETFSSMFSENVLFTLNDVNTVTFTRIDTDNEIAYDQYTIVLKDGSVRSVDLPVTTSLTKYREELAKIGYYGDVFALITLGIETQITEVPLESKLLYRITRMVQNTTSRITSWVLGEKTQ